MFIIFILCIYSFVFTEDPIRKQQGQLYRSNKAAKQILEPLQRCEPVRSQSHNTEAGRQRLHKREPDQNRKGQPAVHPNPGAAGQHRQPFLADGVGAAEQGDPDAEQADRKETGEVLPILAADRARPSADAGRRRFNSRVR